MVVDVFDTENPICSHMKNCSHGPISFFFMQIFFVIVYTTLSTTVFLEIKNHKPKASSWPLFWKDGHMIYWHDLTVTSVVYMRFQEIE